MNALLYPHLRLYRRSSFNSVAPSADGSRPRGGKINRGKRDCGAAFLVGLASRQLILLVYVMRKDERLLAEGRPATCHRRYRYTTPSWHRRSRQPQPSRAWDWTSCWVMIAGRSAWCFRRQDGAGACPSFRAIRRRSARLPLLPTTLILPFSSSNHHNTHKQDRQTQTFTRKIPTTWGAFRSEEGKGAWHRPFLFSLVHQLGVDTSHTSYPFSLVMAAHR